LDTNSQQVQLFAVSKWISKDLLKSPVPKIYSFHTTFSKNEQFVRSASTSQFKGCCQNTGKK